MKPQGNFNFKGELLGLVECEECRLVYVNPRLSDEKMTEYFQSYTDVFSDKAIEWWHNNKIPNIKADFARLKSCCTQGKLLDVGCGHGFFLEHARQQGYEPWGVEVSRPACDYITHLGLRVFCGQLTELALPKESFDIVTCFDVLDYVANPLTQALEMKRLLRPSGVLMIRVLNRLSYAQTWQKLIGSAKNSSLERNPFFEKDHLIQFSTATVTTFLSRAGFVNIRTYNARLARWPHESWVSRYYRALLNFTWDVAWRLSGQKFCLAPGVTALAHKPG